MTVELKVALDSQERTAAWLARKTGYDPSLVHRILSGERRASDAFKAKASGALGIPTELLFPERPQEVAI